MNTVRWLLLAAALVSAVPSPRAAGEEPYLAFLRGLNERGYGDMAVAYLRNLQQKPNVPVRVKEIWDLEMSKSLRAAAKIAYDAKEHDALIAESQERLNKFLKEHPDHPDVVAATFSWGEFGMDRALNFLRVSRGVDDKAQKTKLLTEARTALEEARPRFKQALDKYRIRYESLPSPAEEAKSKRSAKDVRAAREARDELKSNLLNARFQLALTDYYAAQTYLDPKDPARVAALKGAINGFDAIYQTNRVDEANRVNPIGLFAHMWHGKATEELGDLQEALDIYDEVLANTPEPGEASDPLMESLFADVEHFRLLILSKQKPAEFVDEAEKWLQFYRKFKERDGYQGIALELAKTKLATAEKATGSDKAKLVSSAMATLGEMLKVRSTYQQEAILLRRQHSKAGAQGVATNFDEAVALGDAANENEQWTDAVANYTQALTLAAGSKVARDAERVPAVRNALAVALYMISREQFNGGKLEDCVTTVGNLVRQSKDSPVAPAASSLAVSASLNLYVAAAAKDKPAALERLLRIAEFTATAWPTKPEADDARMALGQASIVGGKIDEALAAFEKVNPKSERFFYARHLLGKTLFQRYATEKKKPEANQSKPQLAADLDKARKALAESLDLQRKTLEAGKPLPRQVIETQLLLAEIAVESGNMQEAANLYQPLVEAIKGTKAEEVDNLVLRVIIGAVQTYVATNQLDKATEIGVTLAEVAPDIAVVNGVLINFAKTLQTRCKETDAAIIDATAASDIKRAEEAKATLAANKALLGRVCLKLADRQVTWQAMVFVADTFAYAGLTDKARDEYREIVDRADKDKPFAQAAATALTRVRVQLVSLLAGEGKYDEAHKQVSQLVAANPKALEPLMEQGRILKAWAEKEPVHFKEAVAHWARLRDMLKNAKTKDGKSKMPEYFEVVYYLAQCLYQEGKEAKEKNTQQEKAKQAEQLLKYELVVSPKLSGPDMVALYNALAQQAAVLQGRSPTPAAGKPAATGVKPPAKPARAS